MGGVSSSEPIPRESSFTSLSSASLLTTQTSATCEEIAEDDPEKGLVSLDAEEPEKPKRYCWSRFSKCQFIALILAGLALFFVIAVVIGVEVFGRQMASSELKSTQLAISAFNIKDAELEDGQFIAQATVKLGHVKGIFGGTCHAMDASFMYQGKEVGKITLPEVEASPGKETTVQVNDIFTITNREVWKTVGADIINKKKVVVGIKATASITAHVFGISISYSGLDFSKTVSVPSLNGFNDVNVVKFGMKNSTSSAVELEATVRIGNPSITAVHPLGQIFFNMSYKDVVVAVISTDNNNTSMEPAQTFLHLSGDLIPSEDPAVKAVHQELMSDYLLGTPTGIEVTVLNSSIPIFDEIFTGVKINSLLDLGPTSMLKSLTLNSGALEPVNDTSLVLSINSLVGIDNPLGNNSKIDISKVGLDVKAYSKGNEVGSVMNSNVAVQNGSEPVIVVDTTTNMELTDGWIDFVKYFIDSETALLNLSGVAAATATVAAIGETLDDVEAPMNLTLSSPGLNGLQQISMVNFSIYGTENVTYIKTYVTIDNPSVVVLQMGKIATDISLTAKNGAEYKLGSLVMEANLAPGKNLLVAEGEINPDPAGLDTVGEFFSDYLNHQDKSINVKGAHAVDPKAKWLDAAVKHISSSTVFPGYTSGDPIISDVELVELGVSIDDSESPLISAVVKTNVLLPPELNIPLDIPCAGVDLAILDGDGNHMGQLVATCDETSTVYTPWKEGTSEHCGGTAVATVNYSPVEVKDWEKFSALIGKTMKGTEAQISLQGMTNVRAKVSFGVMELQGIPMNAHNLTIKGLNNFKDLIAIGDVDILAGRPKELDLGTSINVINPSNVNGDFGEVKFDMVVNDTITVGTVVIPNFNMHVGKVTDINVTVFYKDTEPDVGGRTFLSNYLCNFTINGEQNGQRAHFRNGEAMGKNRKLLQPALQGFEMSAVIPGRKVVIAQMNTLQWNPLALPMLWKIKSAVRYYNPFSVDYIIQGLHETISYADKNGESAVMGLYTPDDLSKPETQIVVKSKKVTDGPFVNLATKVDKGMVEALCKLVLGGDKIIITMGGSVDFVIEGYRSNLNLTETIPVHFKYLPGDNSMGFTCKQA